MNCEEFLSVGDTNEERAKVTQSNTAKAVGSGSLDVFATPMMIALMEQAAANLAEEKLPEGYTSVGTAINVSHTAATPVGLEVRAKAEVTAASGRKISYKLTAWDEMGKIGEGTHERFVVNAEDFLAKAKGKLSAGKI